MLYKGKNFKWSLLMNNDFEHLVYKIMRNTCLHTVSATLQRSLLSSTHVILYGYTNNYYGWVFFFSSFLAPRKHLPPHHWFTTVAGTTKLKTNKIITNNWKHFLSSHCTWDIPPTKLMYQHWFEWTSHKWSALTRSHCIPIHAFSCSHTGLMLRGK